MLEKNPFELNDLLASSSVRLWLWLTDWLWKETMTNHIDNKWRDLIDIDVAKNWRQSLIVRKVIEWSFQRRIFLFLKTNVYRWTLLTSEIIKMSKYLHHPFHSLPNRCKKTSCRLRFFSFYLIKYISRDWWHRNEIFWLNICPHSRLFSMYIEDGSHTYI